MLSPARRERGVGAYEAILSSPEAFPPDKRQLVEMLLDGLAASLARAKLSLIGSGGSRPDEGSTQAALFRAQRILGGLISALDRKISPELASELASIYRYILRCTDSVARQGELEPLDEAISLVRIMRGAWAQT